MNPEFFKEVQRAFHEICALPGAEQVDRLSALTDNVRAEVQSLLGTVSGNRSLLSSPALGNSFNLQELVFSADLPPAINRFSDYRLLRSIGRGASGSVYEAEHVRDRRRVAIKVLPPLRLTVDSQRRFQKEAEALARLDHPGIARIHATGVESTSSGDVPYIVMEIVRGEDLREFIRSRQLDIQAKLKLFMQLCDAVHHAHQKGIVHRDLKPGNILVEASQEVPRIKLLDLGIARFCSETLQSTMHTSQGQLIGTVPYMSPEQAAGNSNSVDERSDVYSLGIILYEMLSGRSPIDLEGIGVPAALRAICERTPRRLSSIDQTLKGELDAIAWKAVQKNADARYQSVRALMDDIERFLSGRSVLAKTPSLGTELLRLLGRHQRSAIAIAACFLMAITGLAWFAISNHRLARAHSDAARAYSTLLDAISSTEDWYASDADGQTSIRLDLLAQQVSESTLLDRSTEAAIRFRIGRIYRRIGKFNSAEVQFQRSLSLQQATGGAPLEKADCLLEFALLMGCRGRWRDAEPPLQTARKIYAELLGPSDKRTIQADVHLAEMNTILGRYSEAESILRDVLLRGRNLDLDDSTMAACRRFLSLTLVRQGAPAEALQIAEKLTGTPLDTRDVAATGYNLLSLADSMRANGYLEEATKTLDRGISFIRTSCSPFHPRIRDAEIRRASLLWTLGDYATAESCIRRVLENTDGMDTPRRSCLSMLGVVLRDKGDLNTALETLQHVVQLCESECGLASPESASAFASLARTYSYLGDHQAAQRFYERSLLVRQEIFPEANPETAESIIGLGMENLAQGHLSEAEALLTQATSLRRSQFPADHWLVGEAESALGDCESQLGSSQVGTEQMKEGYCIISEKLGENHRLARTAASRLEQRVVFYELFPTD